MSILIYRNSEQRVYKISTDAFAKRVGIKYIDHIVFGRSQYREILIKKTEKRLRSPELRKMNAWTLALYREGMEHPKEELLYVRWIDQLLGYGVFAAQNIPALCYIGEYVGVIRKRRVRKNRFNDYIFGHVIAGKESSYVIDAKDQGNFSRFINHNDYPNLTSRWVVKDGLTHIILFSNKLILKDQQLTYDYGEYYWRSRATPLPI